MSAAFDRDDDEAFFVAQVIRGTDMQTIEGSPALSFSQTDFFKVLKGAGIAAAGAALTWLAQNMSGFDFGPWTLVVVPILSTLVNAAIKWLTNTTQIVRKETVALLLAAMLLGVTNSPAAEPADVTVTVVTMSGCQPCANLKEAFAKSADLRSYKPLFVDRTEFKDLRALSIKSFPTLLVRANAEPKPVVFRKTGFDGNAAKLASELASAIKRYKPIQRRQLPSKKA